MSENWLFNFDTLTLHAGQRPDPTTGARATPVYNTTSFVFPDAERAAGLFDLQQAGHIYSRISNPTVAVFEERMAALEGGVGAVATASGQAALHLAIATICQAGDEIVASRSLYGGSYQLLEHTLRRFGITTHFVDVHDHAGFSSAINDQTRLVFAETIGNPRMDVLDIEAVSAIAHKAGLPLLVDSTFATPYLCRPIQHGADIVMHSATKFIGGHGVTLGGVLVDGGRFEWDSERFPGFAEPSPGYHGIAFAEHFGPQAFVMKARLEGLRDFGACLNPQAAFYLLQGLETLPVRMARHVKNAEEIAAFLSANDLVRWVSYPGLAEHPDIALTKKYLPKGAGAMLTFGVEGGRDGGRAFLEGLELFSHLANVGDAKSLVIHPASTTHQQMTDDELNAAGVGPDMIRLSIGLEDCGDLITDLEKGFRRLRRHLKGARG